METPEMNLADKVVLALDAHGGDFGPGVTVPAALDVLLAHADLEILLCGIRQEIEPVIAGLETEIHSKHCFERLHIINATHALSADARPVAALRRGRGAVFGWHLNK